MNELEKLAYKLNTFESNTGAKFVANYSEEHNTLSVICNSNSDALTVVVMSDEQILAVTNLFKLGDVKSELKKDLFEVMLRVSPIVPLSSVGLQGDNCILFGSMSVNTMFENIAQELEWQSTNYSDVMSELSDFFIESNKTVEV